MNSKWGKCYSRNLEIFFILIKWGFQSNLPVLFYITYESFGSNIGAKETSWQSWKKKYGGKSDKTIDDYFTRTTTRGTHLQMLYKISDKTPPVDFLCITNPKLVEIETRLLPHYLKEGSYFSQLRQEKETVHCILTCPRWSSITWIIFIHLITVWLLTLVVKVVNILHVSIALVKASDN